MKRLSLKTLEKFKLNLFKRNINVDISGYKNNTTKLSCICLTCEYKWLGTQDNLKNGKVGCPKCGIKRAAEKRKLSCEKLKKFKQDMIRRNVEVDISQYKNNRTKLNCECLICKYKWETDLSHLKGGAGCPKCGIVRRSEKQRLTFKKLEEFTQDLLLRNIKVDISQYKNNKTKLPCKCLICKWKWKAARDNLKIGNGCPKCSYKLRGKKCALSPDKLKEFKSNMILKNIDVYISNYKNSKSKLPCVCLVCGYKWKTDLGHLNLKNGTGCPECNKGYGERVVRFVLETLFCCPFPSVKLRPVKDKRKLLELDCFSAELKLGIEVQGRQHYRPVKFGSISQEQAEENFKNQQIRDKLKRELCIKEGIKLIEIDNTINRTFQERVDIIKFTLKTNDIYFNDVNITEEQYYKTKPATNNQVKKAG